MGWDGDLSWAPRPPSPMSLLPPNLQPPLGWQPDPIALGRSRNQLLFALEGLQGAVVLPDDSHLCPSEGKQSVATLTRGHRRGRSCVPSS